MRRRDFVTVFGLGWAALPLAARAQPSAMPVLSVPQKLQLLVDDVVE